MASSPVSLPPPEPPCSKDMGGWDFLRCKSDHPTPPLGGNSSQRPLGLSPSSQLSFPSSAPDTTPHRSQAPPGQALAPPGLGAHQLSVLQLCASQDTLLSCPPGEHWTYGTQLKSLPPKGPSRPPWAELGTPPLNSCGSLFFEPQISLFCTVLREGTMFSLLVSMCPAQGQAYSRCSVSAECMSDLNCRVPRVPSPPGKVYTWGRGM